MFPAGRNHDTSAGIFFGFSRKVGGANKGLGEAPKAARGRSMKARPTQSRRGVKGGLRPFSSAPCRVKGGLCPFSSVPCGVWGNAPTVPRPTNPKEVTNKGAGSEASLPVTLRVRRRAPQLLFPQESVMNLFFCLTASIRHAMMELQPFFYFLRKKSCKSS